MGFTYINGQILADEDAKISVFDRSYLFGEGLFETFRSYDGKFPLLKKHLGRIEWSSTFLHLPFPENFDLEKIAADLLKKNNLKDARFKLVLSRCEDSDTPNVTVFCAKFDESALPAVYKLMATKNLINDAAPIATMKTTSYLVKMIARREAKDSGFDDAILVNAKGKAVETATGNLFWVDKDSKLWTTPIDQGCLAGVTRQVLLDLFKESKITCREDSVTPEEISQMREVFVTNSAVGVKPVGMIGNRQISGNQIGSVTAMIADLWKKNIENLIK